MKSSTVVTLIALWLGLGYASVHATPVSPILPQTSLLLPSGIPGTSGLPSLSFDTTASASFLSELSSLISSESTALLPYTKSLPTPPPTSIPTTTTATPPTTGTSSAVPAPSSTNTGAAIRLRSAGSGIVTGIAVGAVVAALL